ncbi:hypothetical protein MTR_3g058590 [Medicago truncatula]|uniref:Uncharacterized protein n=1 Tax=Medicago truncatula TaxID=3880 RepID=A0A072UWQ5_MEDTR|nr:hypothetical protein MTR_3g058590 [Medicago truncatula]
MNDHGRGSSFEKMNGEELDFEIEGVAVIRGEDVGGDIPSVGAVKLWNEGNVGTKPSDLIIWSLLKIRCSEMIGGGRMGKNNSISRSSSSSSMYNDEALNLILQSFFLKPMGSKLFFQYFEGWCCIDLSSCKQLFKLECKDIIKG